MKALFTILTLAFTLMLAAPVGIVAQEKRQRRAADAKQAVKSQSPAAATDDRLEPDDASTPLTGASSEMLANRVEGRTEEEAAILPYYNNYLSTYRLGPEDIISVEVFGQERYSKAGIVVPPTGRISYIHIKDGVLVAGKTTQEVAAEITKHYDEYIIDPVVNVTLDKAASARFSILGDVGQPGVRVMTKRYSVAEAVGEAGGVLSTGSKKSVFVLRRQGEGPLLRIPVDLAKIEKGKIADNVYLVPGDQIIVPGNTLKKVKAITDLLSIVSFARIFTGGF
jgi:polysaccharide export outer membrane protein